jgi:LemA protein
MPEAWPVFIFLGVALVLVLVTMYNKFIRYRNGMEEQWSGIEVALRRRVNLFPNIVKVVCSYAEYEASTLSAVTAQRWEDTDKKHREQGEREISRSLNQLMAVAEAYPELRANTNYLDLQQALNQVELEILEARRRYNGAVRRYNTHVQSFPSNIMAKKFNFQSADYFELELATQREIPALEL